MAGKTQAKENAAFKIQKKKKFPPFLVAKFFTQKNENTEITPHLA